MTIAMMLMTLMLLLFWFIVFVDQIMFGNSTGIFLSMLCLVLVFDHVLRISKELKE
jgi:hypothetical protein